MCNLTIHFYRTLMKIKSKTSSTLFSILPNDFKKFNAAFLKPLSFRIERLHYCTQLWYFLKLIMKSRKSSLGLFKQETSISVSLLHQRYKRISWNSFSYSNCTRELKAVPDGSTPTVSIYPSQERKR
jgi:hypothetical protein